MRTVTILIPMQLAGQVKSTRAEGRTSEQGYAMAALLIAMSIMAIMFTVAMPVWKQTAQREKEEELVFRGRQYVHAIGLFQRKFANAYPPNIDVLVDQRFLRKKFKDAITNDDFAPIAVGQGAPGTQTPAGQRGAPGSTGQQPAQQAGRGAGPAQSTSPPGQTAGGISGVTSKSKAQSIRLYNGRGHYNEWAFVYIQQQQAAGAGGAPGSATPGRGGRGQGGQPGHPRGPAVPQPGSRGRGPFDGGVRPIQPPSPRGRF